jgi:heterotetrameric sarcosine oxidase delta subunit|tara:strand:- start:1658 stop:1993 length:336 start_codon:yes stop_codon:yes gene_type:complete
MLLIPCPWCGERDEPEFLHGGEAHIERPLEPDQLTDEEWAEYIFMRTNPKGVFLERWVHQSGCRRWFNLARNTATNEIIGAYKMGEKPPISTIANKQKTAKVSNKKPKGVR